MQSLAQLFREKECFGRKMENDENQYLEFIVFNRKQWEPCARYLLPNSCVMDNGSFSLIPSDTWYEIAELLDVNDIRNLRCVSKSLHETFSSNRIWKPLSQTRWFSIDDQPVALLKDVQDFYSYYRQRAIIDAQIQETVNNLAVSDDARQILEQGWDIIKMNYKAVPILNELRLKSNSFPVKYYATELLGSIRRSEVFRVLSELKKSGVVSADSPEELFLQFTYADPSFDDLLPFRRKVIEEVIDRVQTHLLNRNDVSSSYKVLWIRKILLEVIKKPALIEECYGNTVYTEDVSILRIYAGEVNGTNTVMNAIVQKIASYFDVKSTLTKMFLVVEDSSFHTGRSYVLGRRNKASVVSYEHLRRSTGYSVEELNKLLKALTIEDLVFEGLSQKTPAFCAQEHFPHKFRNSKVPFPSTRLQGLFLSYLKGITSELGTESNHTAAFERLCRGDETLNTPFISVMRWFPFDILQIKHHKHFEFWTMEQTKEWLIKDHFVFQDTHHFSPFGEAIEEGHQELQFKIGDVVYHRSGDYAVIKGHNNEVYDLLTHMNSFRSCQESTLTKVNHLNHEIFTALSRVFWIGYYFKDFDDEKCRFIPRKQVIESCPSLK